MTRLGLQCQTPVEVKPLSKKEITLKFYFLYLFFLRHGSLGAKSPWVVYVSNYRLLVQPILIDFGGGSSCSSCCSCSCCDRGKTKSTPSPKTEVWTLDLGLEFDKTECEIECLNCVILIQLWNKFDGIFYLKAKCLIECRIELRLASQSHIPLNL